MSKIIIAGTDEVGRGSLAGPVVAAAVILKSKIANLQDSKSLSPKKRECLSEEILNQDMKINITLGAGDIGDECMNIKKTLEYAN